jgi:hypothetical protein
MTTSTKQSKPKPDDKEQSKRFVETARELEVDESGKAFKRAVEVVVPPKREDRRSRPSEKQPSA